MSTSLYLHPEYASYRAEVEASEVTLWIRVDSDTVALTPTLPMIRDMRAALDAIEARAMSEAA